ncbi:MAG: SDR family NAD(P)-dependent oxidoreductase [Acidimicrobiia bacterium]
MSPMDASGRIQSVLVLGARSGIARAMVSRFVADGARTVILAGREPFETEDPADQATIEHVVFDATDTDSHSRFFEKVFNDRTIDAVVVAFGVLHDQEEAEDDPDIALDMARVNYVAAISALLHASRWLREQGSGQLIVLSSVAGMHPRRSNFVYGSTKAGLDFLSRGLAHGLNGTGVSTMIVRPGFVYTSMTAHLKPPPLAVTPERVAEAVADGLARRRPVVWVPAILRWVMVVIKVVPPGLVRRLGG